MDEREIIIKLRNVCSISAASSSKSFKYVPIYIAGRHVGRYHVTNYTSVVIPIGVLNHFIYTYAFGSSFPSFLSSIFMHRFFLSFFFQNLLQSSYLYLPSRLFAFDFCSYPLNPLNHEKSPTTFAGPVLSLLEGLIQTCGGRDLTSRYDKFIYLVIFMQNGITFDLTHNTRIIRLKIATRYYPPSL